MTKNVPQKSARGYLLIWCLPFHHKGLVSDQIISSIHHKGLVSGKIISPIHHKGLVSGQIISPVYHQALIIKGHP